MAISVLCASCGSQDAGNAAGPEANSKKKYTVEDANSAQPRRGGGDASDR